jgi:hypothetical protein
MRPQHATPPPLVSAQEWAAPAAIGESVERIGAGGDVRGGAVGGVLLGDALGFVAGVQATTSKAAVIATAASDRDACIRSPLDGASS